MIELRNHGVDVELVTRELRGAAPILFEVLQVWTWSTGEALVVCNWRANYGRGEMRVVLRTGGLRKGVVRVLNAPSMSAALDSLGLEHRALGPRRPRVEHEPGSREELRERLARGARARGNHFRTLGWRRPPRPFEIRRRA